MQNTVTKNEWVAMFQEIGLDESAMRKWHQVFERRHPDAHQGFLESLGISKAEVEKIRAASR